MALSSFTKIIHSSAIKESSLQDYELCQSVSISSMHLVSISLRAPVTVSRTPCRERREIQFRQAHAPIT